MTLGESFCFPNYYRPIYPYQWKHFGSVLDARNENYLNKSLLIFLNPDSSNNIQFTERKLPTLEMNIVHIINTNTDIYI